MSTNGTKERRGIAPADVGVDALSAVLCEEISRSNGRNGHGSGTNGHSARPALDWGRLHHDLDLAEDNAHVGVGVPELTRFRGLKRAVARLVARAVLFLSRVITNRQRQYNLSMLGAVRDLASGVRRADEEQKRSLQDACQRLERLTQEQATRLRVLERSLAHARAGLVSQECRLGILLEEARSRLPGPLETDQLERIANEADHSTEALYIALEDEYRGSREEIKERLRAYLPYLKEGEIGTRDRLIVDIGCGRGEWLELLGELGLQAVGVETNRVLVAQGREKGLNLVEADAIAHLRSLPGASVGAVTAFHVVEHLPLPVLIRFLDEVVRVLRPGGLAIFETPNPENIVVGSCNFFIDPTHQKPLFPGTLRLLAEQRGLVNVELLRLKEGRLEDPVRLIPDDHPLAANLNPVIETFKMRFFAAPDLGLVGRKARS